jgi:hypothetical protein
MTTKPLIEAEDDTEDDEEETDEAVVFRKRNNREDDAAKRAQWVKQLEEDRVSKITENMLRLRNLRLERDEALIKDKKVDQKRK